MRVRVRDIPRQSLPGNEGAFAPPTQTFVTTGNTYDVYALSVYQGIVFVLVFDDSRMPSFYPRSLFEVVDPSIPADWICNLFADDVQFVMGPPYIAKDRQTYRDMADLSGASLDEFVRRMIASEQQHGEEDE
jgi:hypothetical protein